MLIILRLACIPHFITGIILHIRGPQGEVVTEKLHDQGAILVGIFAKGIQFRNGFIEGLLGEGAGAVGRVEDLVVEDGEVEREAQPDGMGRRQLLHGYVLSGLVGCEGGVGGVLALGGGLELGEVAVVVALHLEVEDLGLGGAGGRDEVGVEEGEDAVADLGELGLDLAAVGPDGSGVGLVAPAFLLLLDGGDDPPGGPAGADDVLVGDGQQVALLDGELLPGAGPAGGLGHALHELHHLLVPLRLLRQLRHVLPDQALKPGKIVLCSELGYNVQMCHAISSASMLDGAGPCGRRYSSPKA